MTPPFPVIDTSTSLSIDPERVRQRRTSRWVDFSISSPSTIGPTLKAMIETGAPKEMKILFSGQFLHDLTAAFTEGVANAIRHAHELETNGKIDCRLKIGRRLVEIRIYDHGAGFSLKKIGLPRFKSLKESGRGVFMMRQLMDRMDYRRERTRNALILSRSFVGAQGSTADLDLLYEISQAILSTTNLESVYNLILDRMVKAFHVEKASILLYDKAAGKLKVMASRGLNRPLKEKIEVKPGEGIAGYVFLHAKPCLIEDISRNPAGWKRKKRYKSRSFMVAPMIVSPMRVGQEPIGVINLTDRMDGRPFTKRDLRLLSTIANQVSAYLHICRLHSEAKQAEALRHELDMARKIQQSYLPTAAPVVPGLKIAFSLETAQSVGGDYCDFFHPDRDNFYVVVADVSGHNLAAALTMAELRSQLKILLHQERDPAKILALLNTGLYSDLSRNEQFVSMILARFCLKTQKVELASAGHRPPFWIHPSGVGLAQLSPSAGPVLGLEEKPDYIFFPLELSLGESLVFYTDGLTDTVNPLGIRWGMENLRHFLETHRKTDLATTIDELAKELTKFRLGTPLADDVTVAGVTAVAPPSKSGYHR